MIPSKNSCPECGSDNIVLSGNFGNRDAWVCNECGNTEFIKQPGEELEEESSFKDSDDDFSGEGNLIKAARVSASKSKKSEKAKAKPRRKK